MQVPRVIIDYFHNILCKSDKNSKAGEHSVDQPIRRAVEFVYFKKTWLSN